MQGQTGTVSVSKVPVKNPPQSSVKSSLQMFLYLPLAEGSGLEQWGYQPRTRCVLAILQAEQSRGFAGSERPLRGRLLVTAQGGPGELKGLLLDFCWQDHKRVGSSHNHVSSWPKSGSALSLEVGKCITTLGSQGCSRPRCQAPTRATLTLPFQLQ